MGMRCMEHLGRKNKILEVKSIYTITKSGGLIMSEPFPNCHYQEQFEKMVTAAGYKITKLSLSGESPKGELN